MKVDVVDTGACEKRISAHFEPEDVKKVYERIFKVYSAGASVPGFRPGKAPAQLIRKRYQKAIMEAVRDELDRKGLQETVEAKQLRPIGESDLKRTGGEDENSAYSISLTVQLEPTVATPEYKGLSVEAKKVSVGDEEVDKTIEEFRLARGVLEDAGEGAAIKEGDLVQIDYEGTVDGKPVSETAESVKDLDKRENFWLMAGGGMSFLPGFGEQLAGAKAGDERTVEVEFSDGLDGLQGKKGVFAVKIKKFRTRRPAEMDKTFLEEYGAGSEEELRDIVKRSHEFRKRQEELARRDQALIDALADKAGIPDFSEAEIGRHTLNAVYRRVHVLAAQGIPTDSIRVNLQKLEEDAKARAPKELAVKYLLKAVADAENCVVEQDAFQRRLRAMMSRNGAKSLNELASRMDTTAEKIQGELYGEIKETAALRALGAYAAWTGDDAEEAAKDARRRYVLGVARRTDDPEWKAMVETVRKEMLPEGLKERVDALAKLSGEMVAEAETEREAKPED